MRSRSPGSCGFCDVVAVYFFYSARFRVSRRLHLFDRTIDIWIRDTVGIDSRKGLRQLATLPEEKSSPPTTPRSTVYCTPMSKSWRQVGVAHSLASLILELSRMKLRAFYKHRDHTIQHRLPLLARQRTPAGIRNWDSRHTF